MLLLVVAAVGNNILKKSGCDADLANGLSWILMGATMLVYSVVALYRKTPSLDRRRVAMATVAGSFAIAIDFITAVTQETIVWLIGVLTGVAIVLMCIVRRRTPVSREAAGE